MEIKTGQLLVFDPRSSARLTEILFQNPIKEEQTASLFVVMEIAGNAALDKAAQQAVLEIAYTVFESSSIKQADKTLEDILAALNEQLPQAIKNYDWFRNLNVAIGIIEGNTIHFAVGGKIKIFLVKANLIKDLVGRSQWPENKSLFDSSFSGELKNEDRFLITSLSLTDYLSLEKIKKIVATLPPQGAVAHLGNMLNGVPAKVSFASLIIQLLRHEEIPAKHDEPAKLMGRLREPTGSKNSLDLLLKTQAETEKILTPPSVWEIINAYARKWLAAIKGEKIKPTAKQANKPLVKRKVQITADSQAKKISKKVFSAIYEALKILLSFIFNSDYRRQVLLNWQRLVKNAIASFQFLPKIQRIAILSVIVLALIFSQSLIWQQKISASRENAATFNNLATQISQQYNALDASLIYNDYQRAAELLGEIKKLTADLPETSKKLKNQKQDLNKKYSETYARVWKATDIPRPLELADFSQLANNAEINKLNISGDKLYSFGSAMALSLPINNPTTIELININDIKIKLIGYFPKINSIIAVSENNQFYKVNQDGFTIMQANLPAELKQIDAISFFQNYMYLLDKSANQIYRLALYGNSFSSARAWLVDNIQTSLISAFMVDGSINALQTDGTILQLAGGGKEQKTLQFKIEPGVSAATVLRSPENSQYYYLLDPANKRFLIFDKKGVIKNQYSSVAFDNLKDLAIDENSGLVYLLNGAKVFAVSIK